ncbi:kinase-like protein [Coprinopsis marcescibilis]|uniref:Kinase-like protein n=1 Tax=Coprinopsis marcescibilis TaxID=230819 RepID=A0A5C3L0K7_COPMA|nr:kinase-like protein [Coprinopsis marcescibilis]
MFDFEPSHELENSHQYRLLVEFLEGRGTTCHTITAQWTGRQTATVLFFASSGKLYGAVLPLTIGAHPDGLVKEGIEKQVSAEAAVREGHRRLQISTHDQGSSDDVRLKVEQLRGIFREATATEDRYKKLLKDCADPQYAQIVLDSLQTLLDHPLTEKEDKRGLLQTLIRISKKTSMYPPCLALKDVTRKLYPVAAGHFSEVYQGSFRGNAVAIKVLKLYQHSDIAKALKIFHRESIIWGQLAHENLLPFYGIFHLDWDDKRLCFVSPWMGNGNIRAYINENPDSDALLLLGDILSGIQYLHSEGIVHADLKGDNILATASGRACLADFGLSKLIDSEAVSWTSMHTTAQQGGTLRWQAPELIDPDSEHVSANKQSDMFSFGGVCYEVLTGKVPFYECSRDAKVSLKVMSGQLPSKPLRDETHPSRVHVLEALWEIMVQCWARDPQDRPDAERLLKMDLVSDASANDTRPHDSWRGLTASQFRSAMYTPEPQRPLSPTE